MESSRRNALRKLSNIWSHCLLLQWETLKWSSAIPECYRHYPECDSTEISQEAAWTWRRKWCNMDHFILSPILLVMHNWLCWFLFHFCLVISHCLSHIWTCWSFRRALNWCELLYVPELLWCLMNVAYGEDLFCMHSALSYSVKLLITICVDAVIQYAPSIEDMLYMYCLDWLIIMLWQQLAISGLEFSLILMH